MLTPNTTTFQIGSEPLMYPQTKTANHTGAPDRKRRSTFIEISRLFHFMRSGTTGHGLQAPQTGIEVLPITSAAM